MIYGDHYQGKQDDDGFLKAYGLAFLHFNLVEDKVSSLIFIKKYYQLNTQQEFTSEEKEKWIKIENLTLGQKIVELEKVLENEILIKNLKNLNTARRRLAHNTIGRLESGELLVRDKTFEQDQIRGNYIWPDYEKEKNWIERLNLITQNCYKIIQEIEELLPKDLG